MACLRVFLKPNWQEITYVSTTYDGPTRGVSVIRGVLVGCLVVGISGCGFDGGPIFTGGESSNVKVFEPVNDDAPISVRVKQALRNNAQTSLERIRVSSQSDDTVTLSGFVSNDAARYEAERIAGRVSGVRFVQNNLDVARN